MACSPSTPRRAPCRTGATGEDYESGTTRYELTVRASDGSLHSEVTVTVNVTDVAEAQEVTETQQSVSEPDGQDLPDGVSTTGRVAVGGSATGKIHVFNDHDWFAVELEAGSTYRIDLEGSWTGGGTMRNPHLGSVRDADGVRILYTRDDDGGAGYNARVTFTATDAGTYYLVAGNSYVYTGGGEYDSKGTYTLSVTEVPDDLAPAFAEGSYAFSLAENADGGAASVALGAVSATDPENSTITYSIEAGDSGGLFEIDAASGEVFYIGVGEDYESGTTRYELTVRASDGSLHSDVTVTVNVTDVAEAPAFAETSYAFDLAENADGGAASVALGAVSATDPENSTITYSIEAGDSGGLFAIDSETGALSYRGTGEDYESGTTRYELTVRASDGSLHSEVTVTVNVTDVAEAQEVTETQQSVSEPDGQDLPDGVSTTGRVAVGGSATGKIHVFNDHDWFAVELEAGSTYRIDLEGSWTGGGTMRNPHLGSVRDADGVRILYTRDDDGGVGWNSRVRFTATDAGTYYLVAGNSYVYTGGGEYDSKGTYTLSVTAVVDDFEAGTGTSGAVAVGGSVTSDIEFGDDRDWFAVELDAGRIYRIDLEDSETGDGTLSNPYLRGIYDADGNFIGSTTDNNGGAGYNSRVYFTADDAGTYYVAAGSYGETVGTYTLSVTEVVDDFEAGTGTSGAVEVGGSATGEIDYIVPGTFGYDDHDWFAVDLEKGTTYLIDLRGSETGDGTVDDPYLWGVFGADGNFIPGTRNDNGGAGWNSRVTFTAEEDATYYVAAGSYQDTEGTYTLSVTEPTDDFAAGTGTTGAVAVGGSVTGDIEFHRDRDWFAVELDAGKRYRIDLEGSSTGDSTLYNPYLRGVHDADGLLLAGTTDNNGGAGYNSRVYFTAEDAGTYYVAAGAYGEGEGTYTLSVEEEVM